jgi:hypothetical protein
MDQTRAENVVRDMLDSIRDTNTLTDLAHGFDIAEIRAEPHDNYGIGGGPHWTVHVIAMVPVVVAYHPPGAPPDELDLANLEQFRSELEQRVAACRIGPAAMARGLRWGTVEPDEPELKQHPDDDRDPHWNVPLSIVVY